MTGWHFAEYETHRRGQDLAPITLDKELGTLRRFVEYFERIEAIDDGLAEKARGARAEGGPQQ